MSHLSNWLKAKIHGNSDDYHRYRVGVLLGAGSGGRVYEAIDHKNNKRVAIKQFNIDQSDSAKYEASMLRQCDHGNIIKFLELLASPTVGELWLVMEIMDGTLQGELERNNAVNKIMPEYLSKIYVFQLLRALNHISRLSILHGDVKPANILIGFASGCAKLADFGLAQIIKPGANLQRTIVTAYYRPPEVAMHAKQYGFPVDIWSCGLVMAQCLLGYQFYHVGYYGANETMNDKNIIANLLSLIGRPSKDDLQCMGVDGKELLGLKPMKTVKRLEQIIGNLTPPAKEIIGNIIVYNPLRRPSANVLLRSGYFDDIRAHPHCQLMPGEVEPLKELTNETSNQVKPATR